MAKELTDELYAEFIEYFERQYPALRAKFSKLEWALVPGRSPYCTAKPLDIDNEVFDEFRRLELEWFIENDITPQYEDQGVFVNVIVGQTKIPHKWVRKVIKITDNSYSVICETDAGEIIEYSVVGNIEYINKKLGIVSHGV
jgi:hypothetical protein